MPTHDSSRQKLPFRSFRRKSWDHRFRWYGWTEGLEQLGAVPNFHQISHRKWSLHLTHSIQSQLAKLGHHTHPMREACQLHCVGIHEICLWETVQLIMWWLLPWRTWFQASSTHRIACVFESLCKQSESIWFHSTSGTFSFESSNVWWHCDSFNASGLCLIHWLFSTSLWVWARLSYNSPVGIMAGIMSHSQATARIRTHSMTTFEYWAYQPKHPSIITSSPSRLPTLLKFSGLHLPIWHQPATKQALFALL